MGLFEATKERSNNLEKTVPCLSYNQAQISGTREGFFSHGTICPKTQKQIEWWKCALIFMHQNYIHYWKTVLNLTLWHPLGFGDFRKKKRLNACGFAREFLWSGMLYRPGKSLKRRGKSSSLHSKKIFCLGDAGFLWVTSQVEDF